MYDVVIIGGGPAGSSSAIRLNRMGHKVLVMEKEKFPRPHVGESLVPFCYGHFKDLGILEELEKSAVRKPGVKFINSDGSYDTTYCFENLLDGPEYLSFHVLRARFDKQLLDKAKADGAEVWEECTVKNVEFVHDDLSRILYSRDGKEAQVEARFVIDATGQDTYLAKKLKTKSKYEGLDRIAFLNHWSKVKEGTQLEQGLLHLCYLDQSKNGWIGVQAVDYDRVSVGVVVDFKSTREFKANYKGNNWKEAFYLNELQNTPFTKDLLANASTVQNLLVVGDYSYLNDKKFGNNYACIGDAAGFLDPIFATGVYLALNTSDIVSKAIDVRLKEGLEKGNEALQNAYGQYEGAMSMLSKFINNFYDPSFVNLAELGEKLDSTKDEDHIRHKIAFSIVHFLMGGDFFNEYKRYSDFVDFLKQPKQLARYVHLVMADPKYQETGCPEDLHKIFPMLAKA